jgi:hypothetical protein
MLTTVPTSRFVAMKTSSGSSRKSWLVRAALAGRTSMLIVVPVE